MLPCSLGRCGRTNRFGWCNCDRGCLSSSIPVRRLFSTRRGSSNSNIFRGGRHREQIKFSEVWLQVYRSLQGGLISSLEQGQQGLRQHPFLQNFWASCYSGQQGIFCSHWPILTQDLSLVTTPYSFTMAVKDLQKRHSPNRELCKFCIQMVFQKQSVLGWYAVFLVLSFHPPCNHYFQKPKA